MADIAKRDSNRVPTLLGVSSVDNATVVTIAANPVTHAMLIDGTSLYTALDGRYLEKDGTNGPLTGTRITRRTGSTTTSANPTINTDLYDEYLLTAQAGDIASFTTNLTGSPVEGDTLWISITGTATRAIAWGAKFEASTVDLPTTTVSTARLDCLFVWNTVNNVWRIVDAS